MKGKHFFSTLWPLLLIFEWVCTPTQRHESNGKSRTITISPFASSTAKSKHEKSSIWKMSNNDFLRSEASQATSLIRIFFFQTKNTLGLKTVVKNRAKSRWTTQHRILRTPYPWIPFRSICKFKISRVPKIQFALAFEAGKGKHTRVKHPLYFVAGKQMLTLL